VIADGDGRIDVEYCELDADDTFGMLCDEVFEDCELMLDDTY